MEMKKGEGVKVKYDKKQGYVIIEKDVRETGYAGERKQCSTCEHLRKAVIVKETLFDEAPGTSAEPLGVCTLGFTWRVIYKPDTPIDFMRQHLRLNCKDLNCNKLYMGLKDTYDKCIKEEK